MHSFTQLLHEVLTKAASLFLLLFVSCTDTKTKYSIGDHVVARSCISMQLYFYNFVTNDEEEAEVGILDYSRTFVHFFFLAKLKLTTAFFKNYNWFCGMNCQLYSIDLAMWKDITRNLIQLRNKVA